MILERLRAIHDRPHKLPSALNEKLGLRYLAEDVPKIFLQIAFVNPGESNLDHPVLKRVVMNLAF